MSAAQPFCIVLALAAAVASSACGSLDYDHLERHVLATDVNGRIVDLRTGGALGPGEPVDQLISSLLQDAHEAPPHAPRAPGSELDANC